MNMDIFTVNDSATVIDALKKIDENKKGFVIVVNDYNSVLGTLTDGDIRRAFIHGYNIESYIVDVYNRNYKKIDIDDKIGAAIELFKNDAIKFLPIVNSDNQLVNVITKKQVHALLLQDIHADLLYDFQSLDENIVDYEIFNRPWGFYKTTVMNDYFQAKVIFLNPKSQISLQLHDRREEHWIVAHGKGQVQLEQSVFDVQCGSSVFIPKGAKHRLKNTDEIKSLILIEVQIGDYFGEDDITRFEDIYGRVKKEQF